MTSTGRAGAEQGGSVGAMMRRPISRVLGLSVVVAAAAGTLLVTIPDVDRSARPTTWPALALLAIGFGASMLFAFHIEHDREAHSFSVSDVPLALALVFAPPFLAVGLRVAISVVIMSAKWRSPAYKQLFNGSLFALELALAYHICRAIAPVGSDDHVVVLAAGAGLIAANLLSSALVSLAIASFEGSLRRRIVDEMRTNAIVTIAVGPLAVLSVAATLVHPALMVVPIVHVAAAWAVVERFGRLSQEHRDLTAVHGFAGLVGRSAGLDDIVDDAVGEFARLLRAERATIHVVEGGATVARASVGLDAPTPATAPPTDGTGAVECRMTASGEIDLDAAGRSNALLVPVTDKDGIVGVVVVADRQGAGPAFGAAERRRAATLAGQLAANLRKALLLGRVEHDASHDALTGLPNRIAFERALDIEPAVGPGYAAVVMLGLDRMKEINDTLGHQFGDELLQRVADRLRDQIDDTELLARFGGDEFAILVRRASSQAVFELADAIRQESFAPIRLGDLDVVVTASVGIAGLVDAAHDGAELLRRADVAMFVAKRDHTNVEAYRPEIDRRRPDRLSLLSSLRHALVSGGLEVHYQPKIDLARGVVVGAEALTRWTHPTRGPISPIDFVQLAEESGLIGQLTDFVLSKAIRAERAWHRAGFDLRVAVNLSTHDLLDERLPRRIEDLLDEAGTPPDRLTLEITESALLADTPRTMTTIQRLDTIGVRIALDDFGTGYSSLSYLRRLPVAELKVDQSFVKNLLLDEQDAVIVRSTIDLGHNLGLRVVAEGIENQPVLDELISLGCDVGQGFGISRPLAPVHFDAWLRSTEYAVTREAAAQRSRAGAPVARVLPASIA